MPSALFARLTAVVVAAAALLPCAVSWADAGSDSAFVADTNAARQNAGLRAYSVPGDLSAVARRWAAHMAAHHTLAHNPSFTSEVCCWSSLGENVGVGATVRQIHRAFMASSPHRANILSRSFTQVGIGTARGSDGRLYVDELFRRPAGAQARTSRTSTASTTRTSTVTQHPSTVPVTGLRAAPPAPRVGHASRSLRRRALVIERRRPARLVVLTAPWQTRLAWARAGLTLDAYADPVAGALAYVRAVQRYAGSPAA